MAISHELQQLLQPVSQSKACLAARDQLNATLKNAQSDQQALDGFLASASAENERLQAELASSQTSLDASLKQARVTLLQVQQDTEALHAQHLQLEDELIDHRNELISATSTPVASTSKTVLEDLEGLHTRVKDLQSAGAYFAVLEKAEQQSLEASKAIQAQDLEAAFKSFGALADYTRSLADRAKSNELVQASTFVRAVLVNTFDQLKQALSTKLASALDSIGWPVDLKASDYDPRLSTSKAFEAAFVDLLKLQRTGEQCAAEFLEFPTCLPLEALLAPLTLRFRYHFDGKRSTNRLDKPEWYFAHILNLISAHSPFINNVIQPLLNKHGYRQVNAQHDFISLLLGLIERKLNHSVPQLLDLPPIFAHTIFQALQFDAAVTEQYDYSGIKSEGWKGTADVILGNEDWFEGWKMAEKKYSEDKYYEIIGSPDAWQINEDYSEASGIKPTNSALRVRDLIESVTDRYRPLPLFTYRLAFLVTVQMPLIEAYHLRISSAVDAFETLNTGMLSAVPGALSGDAASGKLTAGVNGVQRLVRAGISARWFSNVCRAWGDEVFFLDLWQDLKELSLDGLDEDTRAAAERLVLDSKNDESTLFDGFADSFMKLATRTEEILNKHVLKEVLSELKVYTSKRWDFDTIASDSGLPEALSPEITAALTLYQALLTSLSSSLPPAQFQPIFRHIASSISDLLYSKIAISRIFSQQGGQQLLYDITSGWEAAATEARVRKPTTGMHKVKDAARLLALPAGVDAGAGISFAKAMSAAWNDNDAKFGQVMQDMGVKDLSRSQAQAVLRKRPECWK